MHVTYKPEDGDPQEWEFDPLKIRASQAEMIERRFGGNFGEWTEGVQSANMRARRVLLWHLMLRQHPTLRYEDVPDFYAGELEVTFTVAELTLMRERAVKADVPEDKREMVLITLDRELTQAMAREEQALGKASLPDSAATGG